MPSGGEEFLRTRTLSGTWFGNYHVLRRIGLGGMGTVYLARHVGDTGVARLFAVKVMHDHLIGDDGALAMLFDEARLAALLHHPNVVEIFNLEHFHGRYYLVMEYVEGATLSQLLKRNADYRPAAKVVTIVLDALHGLYAAHSVTDLRGDPMRMVHRDVSTDNILVGVDGTARLADFGIAKATGRTSSTQPGVRKGKYAFMAPEQVMAGPVDHRADLFSLGIVLYNALTGTRLFYGPSDPATLHNIIYEPVEPPSEVGLRPPEALDPVVMRALERDPDSRFESAAEMIRALKRAAADAGLEIDHLGVGSWVRESFATELRARRDAVKNILVHLGEIEGSVELEDRMYGPTDPTDICTPPTVETSVR